MFLRLWSLLLFLCIASCSGSDEHLLRKFEQQIHLVHSMTQGSLVLDMAKITDFAWDSVYIINDDSGLDTDNLISYKIGFAWSSPAIPNNSTRILFVREKEVVAYFDCSDEVWPDKQPFALPIFLYSCTGQMHGFARHQAKFTSFRQCISGSICYPLIPMQCLDIEPAYKEMIEEGCIDLPAQLARNKWVMDSIGREEGHMQIDSAQRVDF